VVNPVNEFYNLNTMWRISHFDEVRKNLRTGQHMYLDYDENDPPGQRWRWGMNMAHVSGMTPVCRTTMLKWITEYTKRVVFGLVSGEQRTHKNHLDGPSGVRCTQQLIRKATLLEQFRWFPRIDLSGDTRMARVAFEVGYTSAGVSTTEGIFGGDNYTVRVTRWTVLWKSGLLSLSSNGSSLKFSGTRIVNTSGKAPLWKEPSPPSSRQSISLEFPNHTSSGWMILFRRPNIVRQSNASASPAPSRIDAKKNTELVLYRPVVLPSRTFFQEDAKVQSALVIYRFLFPRSNTVPQSNGSFTAPSRNDGKNNTELVLYRPVVLPSHALFREDSKGQEALVIRRFLFRRPNVMPQSNGSPLLAPSRNDAKNNTELALYHPVVLPSRSLALKDAKEQAALVIRSFRFRRPSIAPQSNGSPLPAHSRNNDKSNTELVLYRPVVLPLRAVFRDDTKDQAALGIRRFLFRRPNVVAQSPLLAPLQNDTQNHTESVFHQPIVLPSRARFNEDHYGLKRGVPVAVDVDAPLPLPPKAGSSGLTILASGVLLLLALGIKSQSLQKTKTDDECDHIPVLGNAVQYQMPGSHEELETVAFQTTMACDDLGGNLPDENTTRSEAAETTESVELQQSSAVEAVDSVELQLPNPVVSTIHTRESCESQASPDESTDSSELEEIQLSPEECTEPEPEDIQSSSQAETQDLVESQLLSPAAIESELGSEEKAETVDSELLQPPEPQSQMLNPEATGEASPQPGETAEFEELHVSSTVHHMAESVELQQLSQADTSESAEAQLPSEDQIHESVHAELLSPVADSACCESSSLVEGVEDCARERAESTSSVDTTESVETQSSIDTIESVELQPLSLVEIQLLSASSAQTHTEGDFVFVQAATDQTVDIVMPLDSQEDVL